MNIFKDKQKVKGEIGENNSCEAKRPADEVLFEIATKTPLISERRTAAEKITDEFLLSKLAVLNGDKTLLKRIKNPEILLYIVANEDGEIAKAAYDRLKNTIAPNDLKEMIVKKLDTASCKNMISLLQTLKDLCPSNWKGYIKENTIKALLDLRYWKDISKTAPIFWELYIDKGIRKILLKAENEYQQDMQQWEGEYNHLAELLIYMLKQKHNKDAFKLALELYSIEEYKEYMEKKGIEELLKAVEISKRNI